MTKVLYTIALQIVITMQYKNIALAKKIVKLLYSAKSTKSWIQLRNLDYVIISFVYRLAEVP